MNDSNGDVVTLALIFRYNVSAIAGVDSILHYGRPRPGSEGIISLLAGDKLDTASLVDRDFKVRKQKYEDKPVHFIRLICQKQ